jgi:V8-like Glu-specific endopeptidase
MNSRRRLSTLFAALALVAASARAEDPLSSLRVPMPLDSGSHANTGTQPAVVLSFPVVVEGAAWLRLEFESIELAGSDFDGTGAVLRITSLYDAAVQELHAVHVEQWRKTSAYFNGDEVLVEVLAQPGTGPSRVVLAAVTAELAALPESICGTTDDRVLSYDNRAGRLVPVGCTGWVIDDCNSCMLTAGHCTGTNLQVLQFNVPLSTSTGSIQNPPPQDQYAIDTANVQTNGGQGVGNDWAYFGVFPNSNTGLTPAQAYGGRFSLRIPPPLNTADPIRVTGFGTRSSPATWSQVQETHVGGWVTNSGNTLQYTPDTTGGNSGSPVIHEPTGRAIGIHTHGGCTATGGANAGTSANHPGLQAALAAPTGVCAAGFSIVGGIPASLSIGVSTTLQIQAGPGVVAGTPTLHYRYSGGAFTALAMTAGSASLYSGVLPPPQCGDTPEFYISAQTASCGLLTNPPNAPTVVHAPALTGGVSVDVFADNFQTDKGWTTAIVGATAGQWQRGVPVNDAGWAYDPASDGDGSGSCFLTQNAAGNTDVDGGSVVLTSPALDLTGGSCSLRYLYYLNLTITDGIDRLLVEASSNGTSGPWVAIASHTTSATTWRSAEVTAAQLTAAGIASNANVRVRFTANDSGTASIVEAGVDGFRVVRGACSLVERYCQSGALGSVITVGGSTSVAANNLVLTASNIPPQKSGLFYCATARQSTPFGNGTRCVGTPALRLPIVNSGTATTLTHAVDLAAAPLAPMLPGELWNFQCWFRDGVQFDLSDAVQVLFVP